MDGSFTQIVVWLILVVMSLKLAFYVWYLVKLYFLPKLGFKKDIREYGEWAVVTGSTDGIGKEFAKQLAERGLNILLVSRKEEKLRKVAEEIKQCSDVKVEWFVYDFSDISNYNQLSDALKDLDIGILVNNVGQSYGEMVRFDQSDIERVVSVMNVNMISDVRMTHIVLPRMMDRKKGAVIHISSGSIYTALPSVNVYPATKSFIQMFVNVLKLVAEGSVHHQTITPMYVESNMSEIEASIFMAPAKEYVASAINTFGLTSDTCGYLSHELLYILMKILPSSLIVYMFEISRRSAAKNE